MEKMCPKKHLLSHLKLSVMIDPSKNNLRPCQKDKSMSTPIRRFLSTQIKTSWPFFKGKWQSKIQKINLCRNQLKEHIKNLLNLLMKMNKQSQLSVQKDAEDSLVLKLQQNMKKYVRKYSNQREKLSIQLLTDNLMLRTSKLPLLFLQP